MTYELIKKHVQGASLPPNTVSVAKTTISFSVDLARKAIGNKGFIEVYLDREENKVAFKPSEDSFRGFALNKEKNRLASNILNKMIIPGKYNAGMDGTMMVIRVDSIAEEE
jgi:hypothetical protein